MYAIYNKYLYSVCYGSIAGGYYGVLYVYMKSLIFSWLDYMGTVRPKSKQGNTELAAHGTERRLSETHMTLSTVQISTGHSNMEHGHTNH